MIRVQYVRLFLLVVMAYNVDDTGSMIYAYGFTKNQARRRLYKKMGV